MASPATTAAILDAAERLFATSGYDKTSVREITRAAGVNVAAVHYHFGDKEAVLRAVTDRIVTPLNARRLTMLDLVEAGDPATITVSRVVDAFIRPDFETMQELQRRGPTVARFVGRIYSDQTPWIQEMAIAQFGPTGQRFRTVLGRTLPEVDELEIDWRLTQVVTLIINTFATWPPTGLTAEEVEVTIRRLVGFTTAGLENSYPIEREE